MVTGTLELFVKIKMQKILNRILDQILNFLISFKFNAFLFKIRHKSMRSDCWDGKESLL